MTPQMTTTLDRLDRELNELLEYLKQYPVEVLSTSPAPPHAWSAVDVLYHVQRAEYFALAYIRKKLSFKPELPPVDLMSRMRYHWLKISFSLPIKFKAPVAVSEAGFPEDRSLDKVTAQWLAQRKELRTFLEGLPPEIFTRQVYKHPFAGRLSLQDMLRFFEIHFRRHRKQIYRTLKQLDTV